MIKRVENIAIRGPGSFGLSTEAEFQEQDPRFAILAENCVIDEKGLVSSRQGWVQVTDSAISGTPDVDKIHEYIDGTGSSAIISTANNKIYEGTSTLTDITGTATPNADRWKFINFNGKCLGFLQNETPIVKTAIGTSNTFAEISPSSGTIPNGDDAVAAFGRVWALDNDGTTVRWSDLLDEAVWDDHSSPGSAGSLDTFSVWTTGVDTIKAISAFKDRLIIFGEKEILIYTGTADPNNDLVLEDVIKGVGCKARDSVQNTGDDIIFLSNIGLSSLRRAIQGGDLPLTQLSSRVYTQLVLDVNATSVDNIESEYVTKEGIYLLSFPSQDVVYCFDLVQSIPEDGTPRVTTWSTITPTALKETIDGTLYIGKEGVIGRYDEDQDNGETILMRVETARTSGSGGSSLVTKILKYATSWIFGASNQIISFRWGVDYDAFTDTGTGQLKTLAEASRYGIAQYGIDRYSQGLLTDSVTIPLSGEGKLISFRYIIPVDGQPVSINRTDIYTKIGRLS